MDKVIIDNLELERIKLIALEEFGRELICPQNLKVSVSEDFMLDFITLRMVAEFLGKLEKDTIVRYPGNWKESLKERWFPGWLKSRYPVKYIEKSVYKVCPHIDIKFRDNPNPHLAFLKDIATDCRGLR